MELILYRNSKRVITLYILIITILKIKTKKKLSHVMKHFQFKKLYNGIAQKTL